MEYNIRVKHPDHLPFLGHFTDPIDLKGCAQPVTMQLEVEHIEEDPEVEGASVTRDAEYYRKQAKARRHFYNPKEKKVMMLQDAIVRKPEDAPRGVIFEGHPWNPAHVSLTSEVTENSVRTIFAQRTGPDTTGQSIDNRCNYGLLQVVKRLNPDTNKEETEVNLVPLGGFYNFRKPCLNAQISVELIDDDFQLEIERRMRTKSKFEAFIKKSTAFSDDEEESSAQAGSDSKSKAAKAAAAAAAAAATAANANSSRFGGSKKAAAEKFEIPEAFGLAAKAISKSKGKKGASNSMQFLTENGQEVSEIQADAKAFGGDYEKDYANNDTGYADEGAGFADMVAEKEYEDVMAEKMDFDDDDDEEDEDSDSEEEKETGGGGGGGASAKKANQPGVGGNVDEQLLFAARMAGRGMDVKEKKEALAAAAGTDGATGKKRSRDEQQQQQAATAAATAAAASAGAATTSSVGKKTEAATGAAAGDQKRARNETGSDDQSASAQAPSSASDLTDEDIRTYLLANNNRVSVDVLKQHFMPQVKAMNKKAAKSGAAAIADIVKRMCDITYDVIEGKVVALKK